MPNAHDAQLSVKGTGGDFSGYTDAGKILPSLDRLGANIIEKGCIAQTWAMHHSLLIPRFIAYPLECRTNLHFKQPAFRSASENKE